MSKRTFYILNDIIFVIISYAYSLQHFIFTPHFFILKRYSLYEVRTKMYELRIFKIIQVAKIIFPKF